MSNPNRFGWVPIVGEVLNESSWVTSVWEWLQKLLGRAADLVLWITMIFFCYQLIPHAPAPPQNVSSFMFILQFVALDVGGLGLNRLAQEQHLGRWAYARVVSYILIGITLATITYSGLEHAVTIDPQITAWIEVILVICRSVMTVLYGQAIHSLNVQSHANRDQLAALEVEVPGLHNQVSSLQQHLSSVQSQLSSVQQKLDGAKQEVSSLKSALSSEQQRVSTLEKELETGHGDTAGLRRELNTAKLEVDGLRGRLDLKTREVEEMKADQAGVVDMRRELNTAKLAAEDLQAQLDRKTRELAGVQSALSSEQQTVSNLRREVSSVQSQLSSVQRPVDKKTGVQVSSKEGVQASSGHTRKVDTPAGGQEKIVELDSRRKTGQEDPGEAKVREYHANVNRVQTVSARTIATAVGCSPTTAAKWKAAIEEEERRAVNE